jgi:hypothetical protein
LKFVHHQILETPAPSPADVGVVPQQLHRSEQQIVEIDRGRLAQNIVLGTKNIRGILPVFVARLCCL